MKTFMVIEHFKPGKLDEIYARFHEKGRLLPNGLYYLDSWLSEDGNRCFQLMQTDNRTLFDEWQTAWADLAEFEIVQLRAKPGKDSL